MNPLQGLPCYSFPYFLDFIIGLKVGALWGSNLAVGTTGNDEASLRIICEKNLYDTIVVNSLVDDENDQNKGKRKNTIQFIHFIFQYLPSQLLLLISILPSLSDIYKRTNVLSND